MALEERKPTIGVVVSPDISIEGSSGAEEHVLYDIGQMVGDDFQIELVGNHRSSERVSQKYESYNYLNVRLFEWTLLNAVMLPLKILNAILYAIRRRPDVLFHVGGTGTNGLAVVLAGTLTGVPTVTRNTGDTFSVHQHQSGILNSVKTWVKSTLLSKVSMGLADQVITLGEELKHSLVEHGVAADKIVIIPQPLDLESFSPPADKSELKRELGLPVGRRVALTVSRLEEEKGADRLLSIIETVLARHDDVTFRVIGRGEYQSEFERLAQDERVHYHEYVPHEEINSFYQAADVFVLPSRVEGVPNVILESLAAGVPVLASPVGEVPHMLGETCDSEGEFVERLGDETLPAQDFPERYTWDALQEKYRVLFSDLTGQLQN